MTDVSAPRNRRALVGLMSAVLVSQLGTRMSLLAVPWLVLTRTGSPSTAGAVACGELVPFVLVQAAGGPWIDRLGARTTSVLSDLAAAVAVGAVPVLTLVDDAPIPAVAVLVAVCGAVRGAGDAARDVLVPGVAEPAGTPMERAAGLHDGVTRLASLIGAPVAGVLLAASSGALVLGVDAVTFVVSAAIVAGTVPPSADPGRSGNAGGAPNTGYLTSLREGIGFLRRDRLLLGIATMVLVTNMIDQASSTVLTPVWARDVVHSPIALGLVGGVFSVGAVTGNLALTWLAPRLPRRQVYGVGFLLAGAPRFAAMALASTVSPVLPVVLLAGTGAGGINPVLGAVEYERVPRHLRARVLGVLGATAWAGMPLGSLGAGPLVEAVGIRAALWGAAALYLLATLTPFVFPAWRGMDRAATPDAGTVKEALPAAAG